MAFDYVQFSAVLPWFFPVVAFLFGACVGSFLNVVIHRLPLEESVVSPRSRCGCGQPIAWHDNIPLLSWFLLRGRARCCGRPFSLRYPVVELLTASLFAVCWLFALVWRHTRALPTALERDLARGVVVTFGVGCLFNSLLMDHVEGLFFAWSVGVLFGGYDPARMNAAKTP